MTEFERYLWNITSLGEPDEMEYKENKLNAQGILDIVKDKLLSEVLPYFMHGGEADEVIAKLEEVMYKK